MKKENNSNKRKSLAFAIAIVAIIIIAVSGGTYAYWLWTSGTNTAVSFTVGGGTMTIDGGGNISSKTLAPANCTNTTYAIQRKIMVTASNDTATNMVGTIGLNVVALTATHNASQLNSVKSNIKYALREVTQAQYNATAFTLTSGDTCATSATASGNFGSYSTGNTIQLLNNIAIPAASGSTAGTVTKYYELYIWIDKSYSTTTTDTTITDPLQDLTLNLSWYGSMTQS